MNRVFLAVFAVAALFAATAFAEAPQDRTEPSAKRVESRDAKPRYANTAERWRGRPNLRGASTAVPPTAFEYLPSVSFGLQGQGNAFTVPSTAPGSGSLGGF